MTLRPYSICTLPNRNFIAKLMEITTGDAHVMPTAKPKPNEIDGNQSMQSAIISIDAFPVTTYLHGKFFACNIFYKKETKRTTVKIMHQVLMKETVYEVKKKMMDYLQLHNLWIQNGDLDAVETSVFGWMLAAHDQMVFRPALKNTLTALIKSLPEDTIKDAIKNYGAIEDNDNLPELFINPKWQAFGAGNKRVQTHAVTMSCVNNKLRLMKELVCSIPNAQMPYEFIHLGLATTNNPDLYWKYILINNDRQQAVQGITVKGFSKELLERLYENKDKVLCTVSKHFLSHQSIVSIEETHKSQESGRFIFVVYKQEFVEAQEYIGNFCKIVFPILYPTQEEQDNYRVTYHCLPHLVDSPSAGGAVGQNGDYLRDLLAQAETARGKPFALGSATWASVAAPRMVFDQAADLISQQNPPRPTKSTMKQSDMSVSTNNSSSTIAAKTIVSHSNQTMVSQDFTVAISEMKSMMSGMFERQDAFVKQAAADARDAAKEAKDEAKAAAKEAKEQALAAAQEAKEAAKEAKAIAAEAAREAKLDAREAAAEMREFLQNMMSMMLGHASEPNNRPKRKHEQTVRPSREELRENSPMWQDANRDRSKEAPPERYGFMGDEATINASDSYHGDTALDIDYSSHAASLPGEKSMEVEGDLILAEESMEVTEVEMARALPHSSPATETNTTTASTPTATNINQTTPPQKKSDHRKSPDKTHPPLSIAFIRNVFARSPQAKDMDKTGTAPSRPTPQEELAKKLDFESTLATQASGIPVAPDPDTSTTAQQE
jgi:hypothetical protein